MSGKRGEWCRIGMDGGRLRGECIGRSPGDEPLTLTRCHSSGLLQLYEALERWKSVCGRAYNVKGIKGKICFSSLS